MASSLEDMVAPQTDGFIRPLTTATTAFTSAPLGTPTTSWALYCGYLGTAGSPMKTTNLGSAGVSGGALLPHNVGTPATVERFRALIGAQEGVLYEDEILQVLGLVL